MVLQSLAGYRRSFLLFLRFDGCRLAFLWIYTRITAPR